MKQPSSIVIWLAILAYVFLAVLEAAWGIVQAMVHDFFNALEKFERGIR